MATRKAVRRRPATKPKSAPLNEERRSPCPLANGLEILGDRWTLLIVRDLMFTNRREFGHFLNAMEGISTNILTERLERLQCHGILRKSSHPEHGKKFIYELTDKGLGLAPMMIEFCLWSHDNIQGTFIPPALYTLMADDRATLLQRIRQRECLITLEL